MRGFFKEISGIIELILLWKSWPKKPKNGGLAVVDVVNEFIKSILALLRCLQFQGRELTRATPTNMVLTDSIILRS